MSNNLIPFGRNQWSPFRDLDIMMDNFVDSFFNEFKTPGALITTIGKQTFPKLNIHYSKENEMIIDASVPGIDKDAVSVDITEEKIDGKNRAILTISGKSSNDKSTEKDDVIIIRELHRSSFSRSMVLPDEIKSEDLDKIKTTLKDGMLTIKIPCKQELIDRPKTRKLQIIDTSDK